MFFGRNFDLFHDAYVAFLEAIGLPLDENLKRGEFLLPLVHAEADFRAPIRFGEGGAVELSVARLGGSSYTIAYRLVGGDGSLLSSGETVHCCVDAKSFERRALPETLRHAMGPFSDEG